MYESPRRQEELIAIGRQQLDAQRSAARTIARSNLAAAEIIANEINQQTTALEAGLRDYATLVSSSVRDAADQIAAAIDVLGDRLCAYLGEIAWQLAQQGETLAGILRTLRESRSNEARQLVEQGVRHYINEQYERAEERFRQALAQDTTDYQVLMNLGLIAVQKGVSTEALQFFHDALRLPSGLDEQAKSRALMAIARVHYAQREYREAAVNARRAVALIDGGQTDDVYALGIYAALAGDVNKCVACLEQAIRKQAGFFAKAVVEPDLDPSRSEVLSLLSRLALEARGRVENKVTTARGLLKGIHEHPESAAVIAEARLAANALDEISLATSRASYRDLLQLHNRAREVTKGISAILAAADSALKKRDLERQMTSLESAATGAERCLEVLEQVPPFRIRWWFLWHVGTSFPLQLVSIALAGNIGPVFVGFWFWVGIPVWVAVQRLSESHAKSVEAAQRAERDRRSHAASSARNAATKSDADRRAHEGRCQSLLAEARTLINEARA